MSTSVRCLIFLAVFFSSTAFVSAQDYTKAILLRSKFADAYGDRGLTKMLQRKDKEGQVDIRRAVLLEPKLKTEIQKRVQQIEDYRKTHKN